MPKTDDQKDDLSTRDMVEELARYFPVIEEAYALIESLDIADLRIFPQFGTIPAIAFWQQVVDRLRKTNPKGLVALLSRAVELKPGSKVFVTKSTDIQEKNTVQVTVRLPGRMDELRAEDVKRITKLKGSFLNY